MKCPNCKIKQNCFDECKICGHVFLDNDIRTHKVKTIITRAAFVASCLLLALLFVSYLAPTIKKEYHAYTEERRRTEILADKQRREAKILADKQRREATDEVMKPIIQLHALKDELYFRNKEFERDYLLYKQAKEKADEHDRTLRESKERIAKACPPEIMLMLDAVYAQPLSDAATLDSDCRYQIQLLETFKFVISVTRVHVPNNPKDDMEIISNQIKELEHKIGQLKLEAQKAAK